MSEVIVEPLPALSYATPGAPRVRVWAAVAIVCTGLGMIVLGGCFLIGILALITPVGFNTPNVLWTPQHAILMCVLYVLAFACFAAAAWLLFVGVKKLLHIHAS